MIELGDRGITREEYDGIVAGELVSLDPDALARLQDTRAKMLAHIATGVPAYGVTRGLGHLAGVAVSTDDQAQLQASLLTARAAGFGEPLPAGVVRGAMLVRLTGFLHGPSGVTPTLCQVIADRLNGGWTPVVPSGPYGAAGEIGPLAHLFQTITGEGMVVGRRPPRCRPPRHSPSPASSRTSRSRRRGSPSSTGRRSRPPSGSRSRNGPARLVGEATTAAALGLALTRSGARALSPRVGALTGDAFALLVQVRLAALLADADVWGDRAQPPVSARVVPQVHGAALRTLARLDGLLDTRLRGTTDSPLYLHADGGDESGLYPSGRLPRDRRRDRAREPRRRRLSRPQPAREAPPPPARRALLGPARPAHDATGRAGGRRRAAQDGRRPRGRGAGRWPCPRRSPRSTRRAARRTCSRSRSSSPSGSGACSTRSRRRSRASSSRCGRRRTSPTDRIEAAELGELVRLLADAVEPVELDRSPRRRRRRVRGCSSRRGAIPS